MTIIQDDRDETTRASHSVLIVGTDKFMSGWGRAEGGASYAAWACRPEVADKVYDWVSARSDMERVREEGPDYRPSKYCAYLHIYVVNEGHPAIG